MQSQRPVARAEARVASVAVVVRALERYLTEHACERFGATSNVPSLVAVAARQMRAAAVGFVGIDSLLDCARRNPQCLASGCGLYSLEVQSIDRARRDQRFNL